MQALNLERGEYLAPDGTVFPITNYIGFDGQECEPEEAISVVAGAGDRWFALAVADFAGRPD